MLSKNAELETGHLSGERLFGDDFTLPDIQRWLAEEEQGYYNLVQGEGGEDYRYVYHAFNDYYGLRHLKGRQYAHCLTVGCANGDDVVPLAPRVERFYAIEPARKWWKGTIAGKPAHFVAPDALGRIEAPGGEFDLGVILGVLHHIPNVSAVLTEIARVLAPGADLLLREPISSMGNWQRPRPGLTKNERGLPIQWLDSKLEELGFTVEHRSLCYFPPLIRLLSRTGVQPFNSPLAVRADSLVCRLFARNIRYHRDTFFRKFAPSSVFYVLRKQ